MRRTRKALAAVAVGTAVALLGSGIALADVIENDIIGVTDGNGSKVTTTYTKDYTAGTPAVAVGFVVDNTSSGGNKECDATPTSPLYVTIAQVTGIKVALRTTLSSVPSQVGDGNRTRTLKFEACAATQFADFSTASNFTAGSYAIGTSFYDNSGSYTNDSAFTLRVAAGTAPQKQQQATLTVNVAETGVYGDRVALSTSGGSGGGVVSYSTGTSDACALGTGADAGKLVITEGAGSCAVTATKAGDSSFESTTSQPKPVAVSPKQVTGSFTTPTSKEYDGGTVAVVSTRSLSGVINNDPVTLDGGSASFADKNVGASKTVTLTGATLSGASAGNYSLTSVGTQTAAITTKGVTGSFTANNKPYDRSDAATLASQTVTGILTGDSAALSGVAKFDNANVGNDKPVTLQQPVLTGGDAGNYSLTAPVPNASANITAKGLMVAFTAANKEYNGLDAAHILTRTPLGVEAGDTVTVTGGTAKFADKNAQAGKTVTATGFVLDGGQAGNYSIQGVNSTLADITPKSLTGSFTSSNKVYDGTTAAGIVTSTLGAGTVDGDNLSLNAASAAASFATKTADNGKTVTSTGFALAGDDARNYALTMGTALADITPKAIGGSFTAANKVYDGTTAAVAANKVLTDIVSDDSVDLTGGTATFDNKNVGTAKTVTLTGATLAGDDRLNYDLDSVSTTTADITKKAVGGSFTAANKIYDGGTAAGIVTSTLGDGKVDGDTLSLNATDAAATFADKTAANGKTVTSTGFALAGTDAGNYALTMGTATANITKKSLTITASSPTGVKAGDPVPAIEALYSGFVTGDNEDNSVDPKPTCGTNYTQQSGGGTFSTSCSGAGSLNYAPQYVPGTFSATFNFGGFQSPLNALPTRNTVKAGRAVPVKFKLGGDFGTRIFANSTEVNAGAPTSATAACGTSATDVVEETSTAGSSSLSYDASTGEYNFVWKTDAAWAGKCRTFSLNLKDGSTNVVTFQFTK